MKYEEKFMCQREEWRYCILRRMRGEKVNILVSDKNQEYRYSFKNFE